MSEPVVTVKQGGLRGLKVVSVTGGSYISFKGIPFATPPVGDLRFRDPQQPQPWTGIRDAFKEGPKSVQLDLFTKKIDGDDDCLYLNVATTSLTGLRPVMVWIHGGAFKSGNGGSDSYGPDYLMDTGVVYVAINYRLGVLGFLNVEHEVAPGNFGLKDQVAALKWVKENITQFGGDPNNVTIFGESAGGASVHYLLLSPLAKGLFHKAITQSGVVLNPFAINYKPADFARRYVAAFGKDINDPNEIVEYLRTVPAQRLIEVQETILSSGNVDMKFGFVPSVDDQSPEPFMPKNPHDIVAESSDVPLIIGYNSNEGLLFLGSLLWPDELREKVYKKLNENFVSALPEDLVKKASSKVSEIANDIKKFYFGDEQITSELYDAYVQYVGDLHFVYGIHKVVEIQRKKKTPTYLYRFSHNNPNSFTKAMVKAQGKGATHAEDLQYLFVSNKFFEQIKASFGPTEQVIRDRLVRMWTDFAKSGNPTPTTDELITVKWEPVTDTIKNYLEIDAELSASVNPNQDVWETWSRAYAIAEDR